MKKIALYALAALAFAGCAKEVEAPVDVNLNTHTVTIRAGFDTETKTAYDATGKFSWSAGDKIGVLVTNGETTKQVAFVTEQRGEFADFTGEVEDGYTLAGIASYPFTGEMDGYACNDLAWDAEVGGWRLWGSIKPDLNHPLSSLPLIGKTDPVSKNSYQFKTATGVVKFTVQNVPLEAVCAYLETPAAAENANLNGWYTLSDEGTLLMENAIKPYSDRYNWNVPQALNSSVDYYFFIPVGTIPAGSKFELLDANWAALASFSLKQDVEVTRNVVTNVAPLELDPVTEYSLADILGTYEMKVTQGAYSDNYKTGDLVLSASDDPDKGNVMMTSFAGIPGKQYGTFNGATITFPMDQIFGENPYSDADEKPYVALDFYKNGVVDAVFEVVERGKIVAIGADAMGLRSCTEEDWLVNSHGGGWPWALCFGSITATWKVAASWTSLGNGLFYDKTVWSVCGFEPVAPVMIEIFEDTAHPGNYRMTNPYVAAAEMYSVTSEGADEWFAFSIEDNGQIDYEWLNTGLVLPITGEEEYRWAMFSGDAIANYGNEYSYVSTWSTDGKPLLVTLGPCYRDGNDPDKALYEFGKDHEFGPILFTFPGGEWFYPVSLTADQVTVSSDQNDDPNSPDGGGAPALVDGVLSTYWHSPWSFINEHPNPVYGEFIDIALNEALTGKVAFNYCTRTVLVGDGFPAMVVIGGSTDGENYTPIASFELEHMKHAEIPDFNTWIGLPSFDATGYTYLRFGIAKTVSGQDLRSLATATSQKFTHLAELTLLTQ